MTDQKDDDNDKAYKVGYRKPPLHTRFVKGKCPNPNGARRKKDRVDVQDDRTLDNFYRELARLKVPIQIDGKTVMMPAMEVFARKHFAKVLTSSPRAMTDFAKHMRLAQGDFVITPEELDRALAHLQKRLENLRADSDNATDEIIPAYNATDDTTLVDASKAGGNLTRAEARAKKKGIKD